MASRAAKFVPVGVVAGALGYLCWPYVATPADPTPPKKLLEGAELTNAMLEPPQFAALNRDPFGVMEGVQAMPAVNEHSTPRIVASLPKTGASGRRPISAKGDGSEALVLHGTYLRGKHRVALINEAVYREGDQITLDETKGVMCRIAEINLDKVVLDLNGEMAELSYPEFLAPPPSSDPQEPLPMEEATVGVVTSEDSPDEVD